MSLRAFLLTWLVVLLAGPTGLAQPNDLRLQLGDNDPQLRLETGGPTSAVTALAFSPTGDTLYVGGWDKVVRTWKLDEKTSKFVKQAKSYRIPIGPALDGAINAIAVSPDGKWLAAAGRGVVRGAAGFRKSGWMVDEILTPEMRLDMGMIYLFDTQADVPTLRLLRGHAGVVIGLAFAPRHDNKLPLLVSAAREQDAKTNKEFGTVRLWDVDPQANAPLVKEASERLPDPGLKRPALVPWHTGNDKDQVRIFIASDDRDFRLWDVADGRMWKKQMPSPNEKKYPPMGITAARIPGTDPVRVLTPIYGSDEARFGVWNVPAGQSPQADPVAAKPETPDAFPRAFALAAAKPGADLDLGALILWIKDGYYLHLVDVDADRLGTVRARLLLWQGQPRQPALATARRSRYLAVAGNSRHRIQIYAIDDLLQQKQEPHQVLEGAGATVSNVGFVTKADKTLGLWLSRKRKSAPGAEPAELGPEDWLFDFDKAEILKPNNDWQPARPAAAGWRAELDRPADPREVIVHQPDGEEKRIRLRQKLSLTAGQKLIVTDLALLPPQPRVPAQPKVGRRAALPAQPALPALVAVALHFDGVPVLALYAVDSGKMVRWFSGHSAPVNALAVSPNGRRLVSAGQDQVVCVWSLTGLEEVIDKWGALDDLRIEQRDNRLVVGPITNPSWGKQLKQGEVITNIVGLDGKNWLPRSPRELNEAALRRGPKKKLDVFVQAVDGQIRQESLPLGQGVDEHKPLLSLFLTGEAGKRAWISDKSDWIAWNPTGPYQCSEQGERYLGWQSKTKVPEAPTGFATLAKVEPYHKEYYRPERLLQYLIERGDATIIPPPPQPPLDMTLWIEDDGKLAPDQQGQVQVGHAKVKLRIDIGGRQLNTLKEVVWKLDDGLETRLDLGKKDSEPFTVDLDLPLRLPRKVRVVARAPDDEEVEYPARELIVRYRPPAPQIIKPLMGRAWVEMENHKSSFTVLRGSPDVPVVVTLVHRHNGDKVFEKYPDGPGQNDQRIITQPVELRPGVNEVEIQATNQGAEKDTQAAETVKRTVFIHYQAQVPTITLARFRPEGDKIGQELTGSSIDVDVPFVIIEGSIKSNDDLKAAQWFEEGNPPRQPLADAKKLSKQLSFGQRLALRPGKQTFAFSARAAAPQIAEARLTINYRARLPSLVLLEPESGLQLFGQQNSGEVKVHAQLTPAKDAQPYTARILVNGKEEMRKELVRETALTATVPIQPGTNTIEIMLSNLWGADSVPTRREVTYGRPPKIVNVKTEKEYRTTGIDLDVEVWSPDGVPPLRESVKATANGEDCSIDDVQVDPRQPAPQRYILHIKRLAFKPGDREKPSEQNLEFWVGNKEGRYKDPTTASFIYRPLQPTPEVEFDAPPATVDDVNQIVKVRYKPRAKVKRVLLFVNKIAQPAADLDKAEAAGEDWAQVSFPVVLKRSLNVLTAEAVNGDGNTGRKSTAVNYVAPVVRLEGLQVDNRPLPAGKTLVLKQGRVKLAGQIKGNPKDPNFQKARFVRVYVNGFQQLPAALTDRPDDQTTRDFRTDILVSRETDNRIQIELAGPASDDNNRTAFVVDCTKPVQAKRLHLLILSIRQTDRDALKNRVLQALRAKETGERDVFRVAPFDANCHLHAVLVGQDWGTDNLNTEFHFIKEDMRARAGAARPANEVLMIYYQGHESISDDGHLFPKLLHKGRPVDPNNQLRCDHLARFFQDSPGAHILFMDVDRPPTPGNGNHPKEWSLNDWHKAGVKWHAALIRHVWLNAHEAARPATLMTALDKALAQATELIDVTRLIADEVAKSEDYLEMAKRWDELPEDLQRLPIGRK
jgi:WD40 repeat protein